MRLSFFILFAFAGVCMCAQVGQTSAADSLEQKKRAKKQIYSVPRRASIMSAALPGLGQVYNRKYWKVPIIYAGLGGFAYLFVSNQREYRFYRSDLRALNDNDPATVPKTLYGTYELQELKLYYRRYRDIGGIGFAAVYLLNIIDANVDGHLRSFDVSDDLSMHIDLLPACFSTALSARTVPVLTFRLSL